MATPLRPATADSLERGRLLYDRHQFWEAHEAWESAWLVERGEVRLLLHGLIQVAAGYHHALVRRRPPGAVKLLTSGLAKLEQIPDGLCGLALEDFRRGIAASLREVRRWDRGERGEVEIAVVPPLETCSWSVPRSG
jgi:predicted metal-dependent hydrolase